MVRLDRSKPIPKTNPTPEMSSSDTVKPMVLV